MNDKLDFPGGDEDGKGPRSPRPKRLKISVQSNAVDGDDRECQGSFSHCFHPKREQKGKHCEDEGEQETYEEEEGGAEKGIMMMKKKTTKWKKKKKKIRALL